MSNYLFVRNTTTASKTAPKPLQVAYLLDTYDADADSDELIASSIAAKHISQVSIKGMKKKRFLDADVVYGVA